MNCIVDILAPGRLINVLSRYAIPPLKHLHYDKINMLCGTGPEFIRSPDCQARWPETPSAEPQIASSCSVKQKLFHLMKPDGEGVDDVNESIDNTLHSTSPLPENEQVPLNGRQVAPPTSQPCSPARGSNGSSPSRTSKIPSLIRSNSYTLERPSVALLIAERVSVREYICLVETSVSMTVCCTDRLGE